MLSISVKYFFSSLSLWELSSCVTTALQLEFSVKSKTTISWLMQSIKVVAWKDIMSENQHVLHVKLCTLRHMPMYSSPSSKSGKFSLLTFWRTSPHVTLILFLTNFTESQENLLAWCDKCEETQKWIDGCIQRTKVNKNRTKDTLKQPSFFFLLRCFKAEWKIVLYTFVQSFFFHVVAVYSFFSSLSHSLACRRFI